jgi:hypothetical protein
MSLQQYYQSEQHNSFFDLSAGSIKDFDFFNIHSGRHQVEEEFYCAKVIEYLLREFLQNIVLFFFSYLENVVMIQMMLLINFMNKH